MFNVYDGGGLRIIKSNGSPIARYAYNGGGVKPAP